MHGVCGNNDGEQWTDFKSRCKTFIPEKMPKEFIRDWMVQGKSCGGKGKKTLLITEFVHELLIN